MPDEFTVADSLRDYLTGAGTDGGVQGDPNLSLGGFRSSTIVPSYGIQITNAISNLTIDFASGGNSFGDGQIHIVSGDILQWRDSSGSLGDSVQILDGETKIIAADLNPGAYIRITRTSAATFSGLDPVVTLTALQNNAYGFDNTSGSESVDGDLEYRCVMTRNEAVNSIDLHKRWIDPLEGTERTTSTVLPGSGAGTIIGTDFSDWPSSGFGHIRTSVGGATREIIYYTSRTDTVLNISADGRGMLDTVEGSGLVTDVIIPVPGIAIGIDPDGVTAIGASVQVIADEDTAPIDVIFETGITDSVDNIDIGTMATNTQYALWIKRQIAPNTTPEASVLNRMASSFDAI